MSAEFDQISMFFVWQRNYEHVRLFKILVKGFIVNDILRKCIVVSLRK
jgi:hypothetical protein